MRQRVVGLRRSLAEVVEVVQEPIYPGGPQDAADGRGPVFELAEYLRARRTPEGELVQRRSVVPTPGEVAANPRSKSARLRAARKLSEVR